MEELLRALSASGLRFEQILILVLLGYIFKVQFEQQKQRIWATLEREQRVLMIEEIRRRVRRAEGMVEALCSQLGVGIGEESDGDVGLPGSGAERAGADDRGRGAPNASAPSETFRSLRQLRAARAAGVEELAGPGESDNRH